MSGAWPGNATRQRTSFGRLRRSELMARVRSFGNRTTEVKLMAVLRQYRIRGWRRHVDLVGKPDFVWRSERVAVFVDGCFWHAHQCKKAKRIRTNRSDWERKFERNRARDKEVTRALKERGWLVVRIWECDLRTGPARVAARIVNALQGEPSRQRKK